MSIPVTGRERIEALLRQPATWLALLALFAAAALMWATSPYGVAATADSACYISAASSLVEGHGLRTYDGEPYLDWPPLYPTLLAVLGRSGLGPLAAAGLVNALAFGLLVYCGGRLYLKCVRTQWLAVVGAAAIVVSRPLFTASSSVWTEPLFCLLCLLAMSALIAHLETGRSRWLVVYCVAAALACLQRYSGVALVGCGAVLLLFARRSAPLALRLRRAGASSLLAVGPLGLWLARNYAVSGTLTGERGPNEGGLAPGLFRSLDTLSSWFAPASLSLGMRIVLLLLVASALGTMLVVSRRSGGPRDAIPLAVYCSTTFAVAYLVFMLLMSWLVTIDPIYDRLLSPLYVFVFAGLLAFVERGLGAQRLRDPNTVFTVAALLACWIVYVPGRSTLEIAREVHEQGAAFTSRMWAQSPLMAWLRDNRPNGVIFSNAPDAVYLWTTLPARFGPRQSLAPGEVEPYLTSSGSAFIVWCNNHFRPYLYQLDQIGSITRLELVARFPDGGVVHVAASGLPPGSR